MARASLPSVAEHLGQIAAGHLNVGLPSLLGLLRERVQHVDGFRKLGHVDHAVLASLVDPNLHHAWPYRVQRLPIARLEAKLHAVELVAGFASWGVREGAESLQARTYPDQSLAGHGRTISELVCRR